MIEIRIVQLNLPVHIGLIWGREILQQRLSDVNWSIIFITRTCPTYFFFLLLQIANIVASLDPSPVLLTPVATLPIVKNYIELCYLSHVG